MNAHNDYLKRLSEWGLAGFGIVIAAVGLLFAGVFRVWPYVRRGMSDIGSKNSSRAAFVLMSSEVGLSAAPEFHGPDLSSAPLASMLSALAVVLFFLVGGHLAVIGAFARSFYFAGPGHPAVSHGAIEQLVVGTGHVIELGVRIASPFIAMNFLVTLAFSALGRTLPRMQVYIISLPARSVIGLALLGGAGTLIARHLFAEFQGMPVRLLEFVAVR